MKAIKLHDFEITLLRGVLEQINKNILDDNTLDYENLKMSFSDMEVIALQRTVQLLKLKQK